MMIFDAASSIIKIENDLSRIITFSYLQLFCMIVSGVAFESVPKGWKYFWLLICGK